MTRATAARRYARALFDVVLAQHGDFDRTGRELDEFAALVAGNHGLQSVITNPAVPAAKKRALVDALLKEAGSISDPVARTLGLLADRDRLGLVSEIARMYSERVMEHHQIVRAEVTTAVPLDETRTKAIAAALGQATGRQVVIEPRVDSSILGGVVARVGSVVYDGSIVRQLEKMKEQLAGSSE
jgi:F-type H+-transporting ATPase subunit delta